MSSYILYFSFVATFGAKKAIGRGKLLELALSRSDKPRQKSDIEVKREINVIFGSFVPIDIVTCIRVVVHLSHAMMKQPRKNTSEKADRQKKR